MTAYPQGNNWREAHTPTVQMLLRSRDRGGKQLPNFRTVHIVVCSFVVGRGGVATKRFRTQADSRLGMPPRTEAWNDAIAEEGVVALFREMAEGGDARAMRILGVAYRDGKGGLKEDFKQAFTWLSRAAALRDATSLTACGVLYLFGMGVERSISRGVSMIGVAAGMGSEQACGILGHANEEGKYGFDKDLQEALRWYREMQTCGARDACEKMRLKAAACLSSE